MILESIILPALVPAAIDIVKTTVERIVGVKAQTVDEVIKLRESEVNKLKALAELDNPGGNPSQWVVDLRGSFRYILASLSIISAITTLYIPTDEIVVNYAWQAASAVFSFLFGEQLVLRMKNKG
jgi:hypothetical protein